MPFPRPSSPINVDCLVVIYFKVKGIPVFSFNKKPIIACIVPSLVSLGKRNEFCLDFI